ncbi:MAG: TIGR02647 family protein [Gammaproteobacteria bacterium]
MSYTQEQLDELNVLTLFDLTNHQEGIKIHSNAAPALVTAAQRLHDKGLITQQDGGYLTHLGIEAAEFTQTLLTILTSEQQG